MPALGMGPTKDKRVGNQSMNKATIKFRVVDVNDCRPVAYFRRPGPLMNVTIPDHQYKFLMANGYNVTLRSNVFSDGRIVPVGKAKTAEHPIAEVHAPAVVDEVIFNEPEALSEETSAAISGDSEATTTEPVDVPAEEQAQEADEVIDPNTPLLEKALLDHIRQTPRRK